MILRIFTILMTVMLSGDMCNYKLCTLSYFMDTPKNFSRFYARYIIYDQNGYFRYSSNYSEAYALAYHFSCVHENMAVYIHSTLSHSTDQMINGKLS